MVYDSLSVSPRTLAMPISEAREGIYQAAAGCAYVARLVWQLEVV